MDSHLRRVRGRLASAILIVSVGLLACSKENTVSVGTGCTTDEECIDDGNPCTKEVCDEGTCTHPMEEGGAACAGGRCYSGACCKGCWDGTVCQAGSDIATCGGGGDACKTCDDDKECTLDACTESVCENAPTREGESCAGGRCRSGVCCGGCWDGVLCQDGQDDPTACGQGGAECVECAADECGAVTCAEGACVPQEAKDGDPCANGAGACHAGACCTGCWDDQATSSPCRPGNEVTACGVAGAGCVSCSDGQACTAEACNEGQCEQPTPVADGTPCPGGACSAGACHCGAYGEPCCESGDACEADMACQDNGAAGVCVACGDAGEACCEADACGDGLVCESGSCKACGAISQPCCEGEVCGAGSCIAGTCKACGGVGESCCSTSPQCTSGTYCDTTSTCSTACGAEGEPCCEGDSCDASVLVCEGSQCVSCGAPTEPCCAGNDCQAWATCDGGTCGACGRGGEACCTGTTACDSYLWCDTSTCKGCGKKMAVGSDHRCVIRSDDTLWCLGGNSEGQLGDGTGTGSGTTPVQVAVPGGGVVVDVAAGEMHTCARKDDGTLWCWGHNVMSPVEKVVPGSGAVTAVSLGGRQGCALRGGTVSCWANGTAAVEVTLPATPTELAVGQLHACARTSDNRLYCWGQNDRGQLGVNPSTTPSSATPVEVDWPGALSVPVNHVAAGSKHTCARETTGQVWCWGDNVSGQLGNGATSQFPVGEPVQVGSALGLTTAHLVAGSAHTCAKKVDTSLWCWGGNTMGQLLSGTLSPSLVPAASTLGSEVVDVRAHQLMTCVLLADATVRCSGVSGSTPTVVQVKLNCP